MLTSKCSVLWSLYLSEQPICRQFFCKHIHRLGLLASQFLHGSPCKLNRMKLKIKEINYQSSLVIVTFGIFWGEFKFSLIWSSGKIRFFVGLMTGRVGERFRKSVICYGNCRFWSKKRSTSQLISDSFELLWSFFELSISNLSLRLKETQILTSLEFFWNFIHIEIKWCSL